MLTDENLEDLKVKGYIVVKEVLTPEECDTAIGQYREWLSQFHDGEWPFSVNSLIQRYNAGNMHASWFVRLKTKKVFAQIWKTDKLLSSIDAIAIGRPPEEGQEDFDRPDNHWLHLDQGASRVGLHAYQGAVYLEAADEDDWTLHALEGSHAYFDEFYEQNEKAFAKSMLYNFYELSDEDIEQYERKGCRLKRVPVPKGGMVIWDSRLVHANISPVKGRKNAGRWRFCVFVSMTPAIWASEEDMKKKREAYEHACMTKHWSSQGISFFRTDIPDWAPKDVDYPKKLPDIAMTKEAKLIAGAISYDFHDGNPNGGEYIPKWRKRSLLSRFHFNKETFKHIVVYGVAVGIIAVTFAVYKHRNK